MKVEILAKPPPLRNQVKFCIKSESSQVKSVAVNGVQFAKKSTNISLIPTHPAATIYINPKS